MRSDADQSIFLKVFLERIVVIMSFLDHFDLNVLTSLQYGH